MNGAIFYNVASYKGPHCSKDVATEVVVTSRLDALITATPV